MYVWQLYHLNLLLCNSFCNYSSFVNNCQLLLIENILTLLIPFLDVKTKKSFISVIFLFMSLCKHLSKMCKKYAKNYEKHVKKYE